MYVSHAAFIAEYFYSAHSVLQGAHVISTKTIPGKCVEGYDFGIILYFIMDFKKVRSNQEKYRIVSD